MLVIKVWCLPKSTERKLVQVFESIVKVVESITVLGLKGKHSMLILFPPDMMKFGLGTEILIEVTGLHLPPELNPNIRDHLAELLGKTLKEHFPKAMVQCFVPPFDPHQGYWTNPRMRLRHKPSKEELKKVFGGSLKPTTSKYHTEDDSGGGGLFSGGGTDPSGGMFSKG